MTIAKSGRGKDQWLAAEVKNGKLTISVGVDVLAFAAQRRYDEQAFNESEGVQMASDYAVVDPSELAKDVCHWLLHEEENGDNAIHLMFDAAIDEALNQGSLGIAERECVHSQ